jgi:hypothetical protein
MIAAACHCGAVQLQIAEPPQTVTDCNCSICRKLGVLWAYYTADQVQCSGDTDIYLRGERKLEFHRCKICGCTIQWKAVDKSATRIGVNARLMEPRVLAAAKLRKLDGADS